MVELYVPVLSELGYRERLLKDKATMEYNAGYDLGMDNYDINSGCIDFRMEYHSDWYNRWIGKDNRYYAYLYDRTINTFVGEVSFRYDSNLDGFMVGIIIEDKHRGKGYSKEGLTLLCNKAFNEYGAKVLFDDIPTKRVNAIKLFEKLGFVVDKKYNQKKFESEEEISLMRLNRA